MGHGYLGDGYGKYGDRDPDAGRDEDRGDNWRGEHRGEWRGGDRDRQSSEWRGSSSDRDYRPSGEWPNRQRGGWSDRDRDYDQNQNRNFMFEGGREQQHDQGWDRNREPTGQGRDRQGGFFSRTADEARDWFRDDEHDFHQGDNRSGGGEWSSQSSRQPRGQDQRFASHQDDHYRNWRQQQMDALDRDYQDYCRERQQQFHQDFSSWRSNRQPDGQQGRQQQSGQQSPELELTAQHVMDGTAGTTTDARNAPQSTIEPDSAATLGTNNSENSTTGRGGR